MSIFKDYHEFPNGFQIYYETEFTYVNEIRKTINKNELSKVIEKYKYLFPEFIWVLKHFEKLDFEEYKKALIDFSFQDEIVKRNKTENKLISEILFPVTSLMYVHIMEYFQVPFGVAVLQTWNAKLIIENEKGFWFHSKVNYIEQEYKCQKISNLTKEAHEKINEAEKIADDGH
jgi:hypothetical protein